MSYKIFCDLCGKEIVNGSYTRRLFKIKEKKVLFDNAWWEKIDAHDACVNAIISAYREKKEAENGGE